MANLEWWKPEPTGRSDPIIIGLAIWFPEPQGKILKQAIWSAPVWPARFVDKSIPPSAHIHGPLGI
jgi:hypothetical protein